MNDEIKEILDSLKFVIDNPTLEDEVGDKQVTIINYTELNAEESKQLLDCIIDLQQENERLNTELNSYKDEFCKDTIKEYELVMEKEYYKSRCEKAIEFCDYLLAHDEVVINRKKYIKQNGDDIITNAIKSKLLGGDEE